MNKPKVLLLDIETRPLLAYCWALFDQNVALNQIETDWCILSWAAKWLGDPDSKIVYKDQRGSKDIEDDKKLLKDIWDLLNEADVVIGQNSKRFDIKKLNTRFILNGMSPPSPFRQIDTLSIAKKNFAFTSNKLEYMSSVLCPEDKKSDHHKFPGFSLWKECLKGNIEAWDEMEKYNKKDVVALESLYNKLQPWDNTINFNVFTDSEKIVCNCGSTKLQKRGFNFTNKSKFQRYHCRSCGKWTSGSINLFSKEKKLALQGT